MRQFEYETLIFVNGMKVRFKNILRFYSMEYSQEEVPLYVKGL